MLAVSPSGPLTKIMCTKTQTHLQKLFITISQVGQKFAQLIATMLHIGVSVVHAVAVIVFMLWIPGFTCQPYTIVVSRAASDNNDITLSCNNDLDSANISGATFYRRNGGDYETPVSNTFTINQTTEGIYFCRKDVSRSNEQPINGK